MKINWSKIIQNRFFWVASFAFIAMTGQTFGLYHVPEGWDVWVNSVITLLIAAGIITNFETPKIGS